jgi:hypothetical protein
MEPEIRDQIVRYVAGEFSLADFEEWFVPQAWDAAGDATRDLIYAVELRHAEFTSGHLSEEEFKRELLGLAATYALGSTPPATGSSSVVEHAVMAFPQLVGAGTQPEEASV